MISVKEIENLNKRIEKINHEYTKKKTQQDILRERLEKKIKDYKEEFDVNLGGSSIKETKKNILDEHKRVVSAVEKEYQLKLKVVQAIEDGNYDEAAELLGIKQETSIENISQDEDDIEENLLNMDSDVPEDSDEIAVTEEGEEDFGFGESIEEADEEEGVSMSIEFDTSDTNEDDTDVSISGFDDDEDDIGIPTPGFDDEESEEVSGIDFMSAVKGSSVKDAFADMAENAPDDLFSGLEVEDIDEEEDFGFGDMLSGTKFES